MWRLESSFEYYGKVCGCGKYIVFLAEIRFPRELIVVSKHALDRNSYLRVFLSFHMPCISKGELMLKLRQEYMPLMFRWSYSFVYFYMSCRRGKGAVISSERIFPSRVEFLDERA
jgi:hypothetical protein